MHTCVSEESDLKGIVDPAGYGMSGCPFSHLLARIDQRAYGPHSPFVWKIPRTVSQLGSSDTGGIVIVQDFLPSSPLKKVRTSFRKADHNKWHLSNIQVDAIAFCYHFPHIRPTFLKKLALDWASTMV